MGRKPCKRDIVKLKKTFLDRAYTAPTRREREMYRKMADCVVTDQRCAWVDIPIIDRKVPRHPSVTEMREMPEYERALAAYDAYLLELKRVENEREAQIKVQEQVNEQLTRECLALGMTEFGGRFNLKPPVRSVKE